MRRSRLCRTLAAAVCTAGLAVYGVIGLAAATAQAAPAAVRSAAVRSAAARGAPIVLPPHVFEPYIGPSDSLTSTARAAGVKYFTLDFLQTPRPGSCTVDWNGDPSTPVGAYASGIAALQAEGGQVVPSFGGALADSDDTELADSCHSVPAIAAAYEHVITTYHVTRLDLDTEEDSLNNYAGIDRRNQAIAMVEHWAARTHRVVQFIYTIPTNTTGIDQGGAYVLQNAVATGARIAIVDIMTFDYYDNLPHEMADNTESAATALFNVLHRLYPTRSPVRLWAMIGLCEDIGGPPAPGQDDYGAAETLTIGDAHTVEQWAAARGLAELTFWNLASDNAKSARYQYSHAFEPFTSSATAPARPAHTPGLVDVPRGADTATGNLRAVSCPTASFCMAIGEYGNRSIVWNGHRWSGRTEVEAGGASVEITAVSCPSASFCAAVDTLGQITFWHDGSSGTRRGWSLFPEAISKAGLESVSCPSPSFCVAVGGAGQAVIVQGRHVSAPVLIDPTGTGIQSVSCASASFCVASDWNGDVITLRGHSWSAPRQLEKTTGSAGGGLGSISCPTAKFCVAVDWEGSEFTWNGTTWTKSHFDPNGAGGLISVSCRSASFCMAVDGSGDALTWNGTSWHSKSIDPTGDGTESVSCATTTFCVAVDWLGNGLVWHGRSWTAPAVSCPHDTTSSAGTCTASGSYADGRAGVLAGISCPTPSFCAAVDQNGNALTMTDGWRWSRPVSLDPIAGVLSSVSCASAKFCVAVDGNGYAFEWNGRSWSKTAYSVTRPADRTAPLTSVSCPASGFCVAVDGDGRALTWNGTRWSAPAAIDPRGDLTSVACAASSSCVAVDGGGRAVTWNGSRWSAPVTIDSAGGLTSVSCAARSDCAAVDSHGRALTWNGSRWSVSAALDPLGSGLTSVSCAAGGCVTVDWDGDAFVRYTRHWQSPGNVDPYGGGLTSVSCTTGLCRATDWNGQVVTLTFMITEPAQ